VVFAWHSDRPRRPGSIFASPCYDFCHIDSIASGGKPPTNALPDDMQSVPEKSTNDEIERLHRRRQELKEQSEEIEKRLEQLQMELKKVTGRIVLPDESRKE